MAIEGIDTLITGGHRRMADNNTDKKRNTTAADDFPLFYRTRESMIIDEAICASLKTHLDNDDDNEHNKAEDLSQVAEVKGRKLSQAELDTIRGVAKDVDGMVGQLMTTAFRESYFTCGVINCLIIVYVFGVWPEHFWLLYLVEMAFLLPVNLYHRVNAKPLNKGLYYLDYCWVMNFIAVFSEFALVVHSFVANVIDPEIVILPDAVRKQLFMAVIGTSCGPLLAATAALPYIALLFHDVDTMTGLFIHIFPPMVAFQLRWHADAVRSAWPGIFHLDYLQEVHFLPLHNGLLTKAQNLTGTVAGNALILYLVWFVSYTCWMLLIGIDLPRKDMKIPGSSKLRSPKYDCCFHSFMRGGAAIAIGKALWKRPRCVSIQQVRSNHFEVRDLLVHMAYHLSMTLASIFILGSMCYHSKALHGYSLAIMCAVAIRRGAKRYTYYSTSMYSRTLQKHFSVLLPSSAQRGGQEEGLDSVEEIECLQYHLRRQIFGLRTRIGLVPNYFITRGESIPAKDAWTFEGIYRKAFSRLLKLFQRADFRDYESHKAFKDTVAKLGDKAQDGDESKALLNTVLNEPLYRNGNTILHVLVQRRQLKFIKSLLLYCGDLIDFNRRNNRGQSPLDFAIDRLEVEMIFLLRLYGAKASDDRVANSLGKMEWILTDLIANLDTGRWLHQSNIKAIIQHAMTCRLPRQELLDWAYGRNTELGDDIIASLGNIPQLFAITLADGCDAITNHEAWATLMRHLFTLHQMHNTYTDTNNLIQNESGIILDNIPKPRTVADFNRYLQEHGIDPSSQRVAGRTIFYKSHSLMDEPVKEFALKLSKTFEEDVKPHPLAKEAAFDSAIEQLKVKHSLVSEYPSKSELVTFTSLPNYIRQAIEHGSKGYHPFEVSNRPEGVTALLYCPPKGYGRYANDPTLTLQQCRTGIFKGSYDYAVLARNGLFHGALVDIQHSLCSGRPHLWSFESFLSRFRGGSGRIERGFAGLSAPNVRESGLGDLKHIINKEQVIMRYDPSHIHAQHNILYDHQERFQVSLIEQLGAGLFATALLVASSWHSRSKRNEDQNNIDLAKMLEENFVTFLRGYLQLTSEARALGLLKLMGTDFNLMADQIKMFATEDYVKAAESAPARPVFGLLAKVLGGITHPTAFVHFSQKGNRNLDKPGYSIKEISAVYKQPGDTANLPEGFPRVDTSMMRCCPTWVSGHGWINEKGQAHFGSYEGVLPFQRLIRDLYSVAYLTSMILLDEVTESVDVVSEKEERQEPSAKI